MVRANWLALSSCLTDSLHVSPSVCVSHATWQAAGLQAELVSQPDAAVVISVDQGAAQLR